jgi:hypothetical protein
VTLQHHKDDVPSQFYWEKKEYDNNYGEGAFAKECMPIINWVGFEVWRNNSKAWCELRLRRIVDENDAAGIDWKAFEELTNEMMSYQKQTRPKEYTEGSPLFMNYFGHGSYTGP